MDSKFIKSHQWSLERSHAVFWLKLILNSDQDLALSQQKQILTGLLVSLNPHTRLDFKHHP